MRRYWRPVVCNGMSYKFLQLQFSWKAVHSSALQSGQSRNGATWDILRVRLQPCELLHWRSSVRRKKERREKGLACQDIPIYSIFLCQLSRFCFPSPQACFPSTNFCFHNSHILHHFFPSLFFFFLLLFINHIFFIVHSCILNLTSIYLYIEFFPPWVWF